MSGSGIRCHVCGELSADMVTGYEVFHRVTSDCQPYHRGGRLCVCRNCGCAQKVMDHAWRAEVNQIYEAYSIYHQSDGVEQAVFDQVSGQASARSSRLLECLRAHVELPDVGRLLDLGAGNGALLRTFGRFWPLWSLVGSELNEKYRQDVESIDKVEALYTCAPAVIPGTFNVISMVHVLEHIPGPRGFLAGLWDKLEWGGLLVIEIPDYQQSPFDLLIADHCTHFTVATATESIHAAGYDVVRIATDWIPKELTVVARKTEQKQWNRTGIPASDSFDSVVGCLQWLNSIVAAALEISKAGNLGLLGTSIAATWLFGELGNSVSFFVDEDPHRAGKTFMGRPVHHPSEVPAGSHVFIAMPTKLAEVVRQRVTKYASGAEYHLPLIYE